jgi:integrase
MLGRRHPRRQGDGRQELGCPGADGTAWAWPAARVTPELGRFLDHEADDRLLPLWRLAAYTGARRSELLGLWWSDVDLDAGTIAIRRARVRVAYEMVDQDRTKNKQSERVVGLDPETVAVLRRWAKAQKAEWLAWGPAWTDSGYVFTAEDGRLVHADQVGNWYGRLVAGAGVPAIRFHDLRHTRLAHPDRRERPRRRRQLRAAVATQGLV